MLAYRQSKKQSRKNVTMIGRNKYRNKDRDSKEEREREREKEKERERDTQ